MNGLAYAGAAGAAHVTLGRHYAPLVRRDKAHRITRNVWVGLYVLVAIQCAWTMRPFLGWSELEPTLFRREAWGNAYVHVADVIVKLFRGV